ncbi:MAG: PHB depolymerase family esterase [Chloroflexota bacterium]
MIGLSLLFSCAEDDHPKKMGKPGLFTHSLHHDNLDRTYILYVPESYKETSPVPLMLNFHGFGMTANQQLKSADMRSLADTENFILVYPQGTLLDGYPHWNAGLESKDNKSDADDFGFVEVLIDEISADYTIDSERIYASGYSNGAFFAYSLACFHGDKIAAIGSVAGTMLEETYEQCRPSHPIAMINIHGTADSVVPYEGGEGLTPIDAVLDYWIVANNTSTTPVINSHNDKGITIEHFAYANGDSNTAVEHYKIIGGGHVWFDIDYEGANTSRLIWDFVSRYDINGLR